MSSNNKFAKISQEKINSKKEYQSEIKDLIEDVPKKSTDQILEINLNDILDNPFQPRKIFDDEKQAELTKSIEQYGQLNPILVTKTENDKYTLVAGERRFRACKKLNKTNIKAIIIKSDPEIISIIDNIQREDLHPLERAFAIKNLYVKYDNNKEKVANTISTSIRTVERLLSLSELKEKLNPQEDKEADNIIIDNNIPLREYYGLLKYKDSQELHIRFKKLKDKYQKDPESQPSAKTLRRKKDEIDQITDYADKILKILSNFSINNNNDKIPALKKKIKQIAQVLKN